MKKAERKSRWYVLVALVTALCCGRGARSEESPPEVYQQTLHFSAWIVIFHDGRPAAWGSGFVVDRGRKLLVTNHHVVGNNEVVGVYFPMYRQGAPIADRRYYIQHDRPIPGRVIATDPGSDLAVLQVDVLPRNVAAVPLADESPQAGDVVSLMGNPTHTDRLWVYNTGSINRVTARKDGHERISRQDRTSAIELIMHGPILPGYSGAALVNTRGQLLGVTTRSDWPGLPFQRVRLKIGGLLVAGTGGALQCLPSLYLDPGNPVHRAWCVDVSDVRRILGGLARFAQDE